MPGIPDRGLDMSALEARFFMRGEKWESRTVSFLMTARYSSTHTATPDPFDVGPLPSTSQVCVAARHIVSACSEARLTRGRAMLGTGLLLSRSSQLRGSP